MDLPGFLRLLNPGPAAGAPQQIVINIYGGGTQGAPAVEVKGPPKPPLTGGMDYPSPPPRKPKKKE